MSLQVYQDTLAFVEAQGVPLILMSGGEPTDHPEVLEFLRYAKALEMSTLLLSNGEFLRKWDPAKVEELLELVHRVQVTNDPAYYPRHVLPVAHWKVLWETQLRQVSPHGRAPKYQIRTNRRAPECFNMRSLVRQLGSFHAARLMLLGSGQMCTPSINVDGSISAGEVPECSKIGHVTDDIATIELNLRTLKCPRCGLVNNLEQREKHAVGEG